MVLVETSFGGRGVMDQLVGDPFRGSADARARDRRIRRHDRPPSCRGPPRRAVELKVGHLRQVVPTR